MECIDLTYPTPEENISFDETLLKHAESGERGPALRFWESKDYFVVLGRNSSVSDDVFIDRCKKDKIKIIKRPSGGGTVLLGKGCLNYSLILPYKIHTSLLSIKSSFKYILSVLINAFNSEKQALEFKPVSDITMNCKKVSGNAQARKRNFLLMHGTFLYDFDIGRISWYLKEPKKVPDYRNGRAHECFLTNMPICTGKIKEIIRKSTATL